MAIVAACNAQALGLGDVQVNSYLGEPLDARINLLELTDVDAQHLTAVLADSRVYQQLGLQYPDGIRFNLQLVHEHVKHPYVHITTRNPVNEPFLTLLVEVASLPGKIAKEYTFLIDPAPDLFGGAPVGQPVTRQRTGATALGATEAAKARRIRRAARAATRSAQRKHEAATQVVSPANLGAASGGGVEAAQQTQPAGKLELSLSTSLSISRGAQSQLGTAAMSEDVLQEELIAREKMLKELNAQISEMEATIKMLQLKLGTQTMGMPATSGIPAQSAPVTTQAQQTGTTAKPAVMPQQAPKPVSGSYWWKIVLAIIVLVAAAGAAFWYRKYRWQEWQPLFPEVPEVPEVTEQPATVAPQEEPAAAAKTTGERPIKMPSLQELKTVPFTSREYDFFEQAEIYLRFGHDKLAEDVLHEAIKINPVNPHGYLTLLGIYETRGDAGAYYELAQQFKAIGDAADWKKVAETGRKLDPNNPFYT